MALPEVIPVADLTSATLAGTGNFDILMRANRAHLEEEFKSTRIKGPEYATVYLGALDATMRAALEFTLQRHTAAMQARLIEAQIATAENQKLLTNQQILQSKAQVLQIEAQTSLINQQKNNEVLQGNVLIAQECKLRAEYNILMETLLKTKMETDLLSWKIVTEKAQTTNNGVDDNSVVGRQKNLYFKQGNGFDRDAEQKVAKIMVDAWNVQRTTDEGISANAQNGLIDQNVGRAVNKLLGGVGA